MLRHFEVGLLAALGYALPLTREAGGGAAIDPDARYHYAFDQGARPWQAEVLAPMLVAAFEQFPNA